MQIPQEPDLTRETGPEPDPDGDVWGALPDEEPPLPPPPPPARGAPAEKPEPPPASVAELGPPPDDAMAAAKWAYMVHMRLAHDAMMDGRMSPSARRKEVRVTLAAAAKHMSDAFRYDAKRLIERQQEQLEARKRGRAAAKTTAAAAVPEGAMVIPLRRDG